MLVVAAGRPVQDRLATEQVGERRDLFAHGGDDDGYGSSGGMHRTIFAQRRARPGVGRFVTERSNP
ncbi:hypothetical protein GCM10009627_20790 [Curtobacterium herbarum]|uniref:Uncharacterized protein n=1 Tax=Curtobacterium herbarum TaxID=150122 RepID=A0ABN1ZDM4_9MICO